MVTVARDHQDVDSASDRLHDLAFDVPSPAEQLRVRATQPSGRRGEQIGRFVPSDNIVRTGWTAAAGAASEEPDGRRIGRLGDV
jgi:hypothetical protein